VVEELTESLLYCRKKELRLFFSVNMPDLKSKLDPANHFVNLSEITAFHITCPKCEADLSAPLPGRDAPSDCLHSRKHGDHYPRDPNEKIIITRFHAIINYIQEWNALPKIELAFLLKGHVDVPSPDRR
jgi:hypothetical protein